jgi:hypothetical protein
VSIQGNPFVVQVDEPPERLGRTSTGGEPTMRYMLTFTADPDLEPQWNDELDAAAFSWTEDAIGSRTSLHGSRLRPGADATTVKLRGGELLITDGPFAETKEQIAGYDVLECASLDEAVRWAARHPHSHTGATEVRALPDEAPVTPLPKPGDGKTRYLMFVCTDPAADGQGLERTDPIEQWVEDNDSRGVRQYGSELAPPGQARTVRVRDARTLVTDGPFAETKEQIAGFDVLDCADLDEVIEIAARHPMACHGLLEVRPFWT